MTGQMGVLSNRGMCSAVRFARHLNANRERVWAALTDPGQMMRWLADTVIEPRAGGRIVFHWDSYDPESRSGGRITEGTIRVFEAPTTFEYTWRDEDIVHWELIAVADGTELSLDHSGFDSSLLYLRAAGWHAYLESLCALLSGSSHREAVAKRFLELQPVYTELASDVRALKPGT